MQHHARGPSPLLPPQSVVTAVMAALQRPDYPEQGVGLEVARAFTLPEGTAEGQTVVGGGLERRRSWGATERWLTRSEFAGELLEPPFRSLVGCESWQEASPVLFTGGSDSSERAVQVVHVHAARQPGSDELDMTIGMAGPGTVPHCGTASGPGKVIHGAERGAGHHLGTAMVDLRVFTYSFCLTLVGQGPSKGCWLVSGVRVGDYSR